MLETPLGILARRSGSAARTEQGTRRPVVAPHQILTVAAKANATKPEAPRGRAELAVMKHATSRNKVTFQLEATASHQALLESIRTAKSSFYIETFIWHDDAAGNEVIQALAKRVRDAKARGETFDAKVLIDWFGLRQGTGGATDTEIVGKLRTAGVDVLEFARGYVDEGKLIPITHRKFYIKDGSSFMTGGRNIGDEYLHATFVNPKGVKEDSWHDLLYTVEGDETARIIGQFVRNWQRAGGTVPAVLPRTVPHPTGRVRIESFITDPHAKIFDLQKAHLALIANAESEIVVMYPYVSDDKFIRALRKAKRKNPALSIKVIMPANKEASAEGTVYSALNQESARQLMRDGIEVRMFAGGTVGGRTVDRFSHFKGMVVDGKVLSIGSANGDARTFRSNHELNTTIADPAIAKEFMAKVVTPDWAAAVPLTAADLGKDNWWMRLKQFAFEILDFLL